MNEIQKTRTVDAYLAQLDAQREAMVIALDGLTAEQLWQRPAPGEWSIAEILNHTDILIRSTSPLVRFAWRWFRWTYHLLKNQPIRKEMEDPYRKPSFPHWFSFPWKPKFSPQNPAPLAMLLDQIRITHQEVRDFYQGKDQQVLGHVYLFDPLFGFFNLILALRIGLYHDQLHYEDVIKLAAELKQ